MSFLAERHSCSEGKLSSKDVARARGLSKPLVAKVLTTLSTAGLVTGVRGPRGGFRLAREPARITLADITEQFEQRMDSRLCPFGPDWCGKNDPCPLHDTVVSVNRQWEDYLHQTTLAVFAPADATGAAP